MRVDSADIMATLLKSKAEVENARKTSIKLVFSGASEAHLLADDIGNDFAVLTSLFRANWTEHSQSERRNYSHFPQTIPRNLGQPQNVCVPPFFGSTFC